MWGRHRGNALFGLGNCGWCLGRKGILICARMSVHISLLRYELSYELEISPFASAPNRLDATQHTPKKYGIRRFELC